MIVLAHRGFWKDKTEKNTPHAIQNALENGFGFESDVRDFNQKLVISHDVATPASHMAEDVFRWLKEYDDKYTFAINIKSDGLVALLQALLVHYHINNYFLFDMSIPQMIEYRDAGLKFFTRQSEVEMTPSLYNDADGVWIDAFWSADWITEELLNKHFRNGKKVCIVSRELHGDSDYVFFWEKIKGLNLNSSEVMICTDYPYEAEVFFNGQD